MFKRMRKLSGGGGGRLKGLIKNRPHVMKNVLSNLKQKQELKRREREMQMRAQEQEQREPDYVEQEYTESNVFGADSYPLPESTGLGSLAVINEQQSEDFNGGDESFGGRGRAKRKEKHDVKMEKKKAKAELIRGKAAKKVASGEAKKTKAEGKGERSAKVLDSINSVASTVGGMFGKGKGEETPTDSAPAIEEKKPNYLLWGGIALLIIIALIIAVKMMPKK